MALPSCSVESYRTSFTQPSTSHSLQHRIHGRTTVQFPRTHPLLVRSAAAAATASVAEPKPADGFVAQLLERIATGAPPDTAPSALRKLRQESRERAGGMKWPGRKDEAFRFTDVKPLQELNLDYGLQQAQASPPVDTSSLPLSKDALTLVTVDGVLNTHLSSPLTSLPIGLTIGTLSTLPADVTQHVAPFLGQVAADLDIFSELNGAATGDVLVIFAREGSSSPVPIHVIHATSAPSATSAARVASPRLLIVAAASAEVEVVEEFVGEGEVGGGAWTNAVAEVVVSKGARVLHGVVQQQTRDSFHMKTTAVSQEEKSEYSLIEAQLGGRLSRHNLRMRQLGPDTITNVSTISLCGARQVQDLHSSLVLDHPRGVTRQLHKCIVTESTGHGVFDGNVQVNRYAQQTDAGQLTRSLLLVPRGTVNVKPNLQIIADDVKCTHGAAISDLDDEQLFYFQARGIDEATARSALVFSFAAEVVEKFPYSRLRKRLESSLKSVLLAQGAMDSHAALELKGSEE